MRASGPPDATVRINPRIIAVAAVTTSRKRIEYCVRGCGTITDLDRSCSTTKRRRISSRAPAPTKTIPQDDNELPRYSCKIHGPRGSEDTQGRNNPARVGHIARYALPSSPPRTRTLHLLVPIPTQNDRSSNGTHATKGSDATRIPSQILRGWRWAITGTMPIARFAAIRTTNVGRTAAIVCDASV